MDARSHACRAIRWWEDGTHRAGVRFRRFTRCAQRLRSLPSVPDRPHDGGVVGGRRPGLFPGASRVRGAGDVFDPLLANRADGRCQMLWAGSDEHRAALRDLHWTGCVAHEWPKMALAGALLHFSSGGAQPCGGIGAPPTITTSTTMSSSVATSMRCGARARVTGMDVPSRRITRTRHWDRAASSRASSTRRPMSWRLTASARLRPGAIQPSRRSRISWDRRSRVTTGPSSLPRRRASTPEAWCGLATGLEPALSAWEPYNRVRIGVTTCAAPAAGWPVLTCSGRACGPCVARTRSGLSRVVTRRPPVLVE
jgi:hypothetical protein